MLVTAKYPEFAVDGQGRWPYEPFKPIVKPRGPREMRPALQPNLIAYAQNTLNRLGFTDYQGKTLTVDDDFGPRSSSAVRKFQAYWSSEWPEDLLTVDGVLDLYTWWALDEAGWTQWSQWTTKVLGVPIKATNKYSGQPVDSRGMTFEGSRLDVIVHVNFPTAPAMPRNVMVDRNARGSTRKSGHAYGTDDDFMVNRDPAIGNDKGLGSAIFNWLDASMRVDKRPARFGLMGQQYAGPYRMAYSIFWDRITYPFEPAARRPRTDFTVNLHANHDHTTTVPRDRASKLAKTRAFMVRGFAGLTGRSALYLPFDPEAEGGDPNCGYHDQVR